MGVKFLREYEDITAELVTLISEIADIYTFLNMPEATWNRLSRLKRAKYLETLADDLFFALGSEPSFEIGSGKIIYNSTESCLDVFSESDKLGSVQLK